MCHLLRLLCTLPLLLLPLLLSAAEDKPAKDKDGFVPLFNGKDLTGWVKVNCAPKTFVAKENMIVTTGVPTGLLRTDKMYENFILELEWMHVKPKGNSGLFVWSDPLPSTGVPFSRAIEVQVLDGVNTKEYTSHGDIFSIWGAKMTPDRPHPSKWERCLPSERRCLPAGKWNRYRVECKDGVIKLAVNGKEVSGGSKCSPRKGYICLEAEGSECHFRNLRIKELPGSNPTAKETANKAEGHVTLFTGIDLAGWRPANKDHWKVLPGDNNLAARGKAGEATTIATTTSYGDVELVVDCRLGKDGKAGIRVRGSDAAKVVLSSTPDRRFARFVIRMKGDTLSWTLNGLVTEAGKEKTLKGVPAKGPIELTATGPVDFTNLFVRELK